MSNPDPPLRRTGLIDRIVNSIDHMVNTSPARVSHSLSGVTALVVVYVSLTAATIVALLILDVLAPAEANPEAWGHAVIVGVFAFVIPLRLRAARHGGGRALAAIGVIAVVLTLVNLVEGALPGVFPFWMRIEMFAVAALMVAIVALIVRSRE